MNKIFLTLLLALPSAAAAAAGDCDKKDADACAAGAKARSPFLQASLNEPLPAALPVKKRAELKPAPAKPAAPAEPAVSTAPAPAPAEATAVPRPQLSSPLWLFFVGGSLAFLYFYLREGARRRGRK